jgi:hypothetical protein
MIMVNPLRTVLGAVLRLCVLALAFKAALDWFPEWRATITRWTSLVGGFGTSELLADREAWATSHPFEGDLLSNVPPMTLALCAGAAKLISNRAFSILAPTPIDAFLRSSRVVHLVYPKMEDLAFRQLGHDRFIPSPKNAPLMPVGDATAGALITSYIERKYGKKVKIVKHYGDSPRVENGEPIISIGGPAVNQMTWRIMYLKLVEDFDLERCMHTIHYANDVFSAERESEDIDAAVTKDYGVSLCIKLPDTEQRLAMLFGMWPPSTVAAAQLFLGELQPKKLNFKFARSIRRGKDALAINVAQNVGLYDFSNTIAKQYRVKIKSQNQEE